MNKTIKNIYNTLEEYCKYKKLIVDIKNNKYIIVVKKYYDRVVLIFVLEVINKDKIRLEYNDGRKEELYIDYFIDDIKKEIEIIKMLNRFKNSSRIVKKVRHAKTKLTEYGKGYIHSKAMKANMKNENIAEEIYRNRDIKLEI